MRTISIILLGILISNRIFGTAQIPDLLIYNNDTVSLYANPLESYYTEDNPRPEYIVSGCWSTACWRGYQAIWEVKNDSLFLNTILDCCLWQTYHRFDSLRVQKFEESDIPLEIIGKLYPLLGKTLDEYSVKRELKELIGKKNKRKYEKLILSITQLPRQRADLNRLFKDKVSNGMVFADWFSGDITIPKGNMIEYVHMGYMSRYEKELVLTIENGKLTDAIEYDTRSSEIDKGYGVLQATSYSIVVPIDLINNKNGYIYTLTDTIKYYNDTKTKSISALSKFNDSRKERDERTILVETTIDSISNCLSDKYTFNNKTTEKLRWGTGCWIDGQSRSDDEIIRIFTMSNINSQVIIEYKERDIKLKDFQKIADYIIYSIRLMEFGY
jgi:hypothetical protein